MPARLSARMKCRKQALPIYTLSSSLLFKYTFRLSSWREKSSVFLGRRKEREREKKSVHKRPAVEIHGLLKKKGRSLVCVRDVKEEFCSRREKSVFKLRVQFLNEKSEI